MGDEESEHALMERRERRRADLKKIEKQMSFKHSGDLKVKQPKSGHYSRCPKTERFCVRISEVWISDIRAVRFIFFRSVHFFPKLDCFI